MLLLARDVEALSGTDVTVASTDELGETDVAGKIVVTFD